MRWIFVDICPFDYISIYCDQRPRCAQAEQSLMEFPDLLYSTNLYIIIISELMKNYISLHCNCGNLKIG